MLSKHSLFMQVCFLIKRKIENRQLHCQAYSSMVWWKKYHSGEDWHGCHSKNSYLLGHIRAWVALKLYLHFCFSDFALKLIMALKSQCSFNSAKKRWLVVFRQKTFLPLCISFYQCKLLGAYNRTYSWAARQTEKDLPWRPSAPNIGIAIVQRVADAEREREREK